MEYNFRVWNKEGYCIKDIDAESALDALKVRGFTDVMYVIPLGTKYYAEMYNMKFNYLGCALVRDKKDFEDNPKRVKAREQEILRLQNEVEQLKLYDGSKPENLELFLDRKGRNEAQTQILRESSTDLPQTPTDI